MAPLNLAASSDLQSKKVLDIVGHEYGTIKDVIIDPNSRKIFFIVIDEGGIAGIGLETQYVAIPWNSLNINPNTLNCTLRIERGVLNKAPHFNYSDLKKGDGKIIDQIFNYYGQPDYWKHHESMDTIVTTDPVYKKDKIS